MFPILGRAVRNGWETWKRDGVWKVVVSLGGFGCLKIQHHSYLEGWIVVRCHLGCLFSNFILEGLQLRSKLFLLTETRNNPNTVFTLPQKWNMYSPRDCLTSKLDCLRLNDNLGGPKSLVRF